MQRWLRPYRSHVVKLQLLFAGAAQTPEAVSGLSFAGGVVVPC
jgi:hypothetical protein